MGANRGFWQVEGARQKRGIGLTRVGHGQFRRGELRRDPVATPHNDNRHQARDLFQRDLGLEIAGWMRIGGQVDGTADGRMTRKRDFCRGEENPDFGGMGRVIGRLHENRLAEIELSRDGLHLRRAQPVRRFDNRQRIPGESGLGKHVIGRKRQHIWLQPGFIGPRIGFGRGNGKQKGPGIGALVQIGMHRLKNGTPRQSRWCQS